MKNDLFNDWQVIKENPYRTQVLVDGIELKGVKSIGFEHKLGELPTIYLEITPGSLNAQDDSAEVTEAYGFRPPQVSAEEDDDEDGAP